MPFTAQDVFSRTVKILQDVNATRWPLAEQLLWLNDAVREVVIHKPNATARTVSLPLAAGTKQSLPIPYNTLIQVVRNATGAAVTPVSRQLVDAFLPGWHDTSVIPAAATVRHVVDDSDDPKTFYVVPANDGTGALEVVVSVLPTALAMPVSNPNALASYAALTVDMDDLYQNVLTDYVLYRSFSKDMSLPGAAARATAHYQLFAQAIGLKLQGEMRNVNKPVERPVAG